MPDSLNTQSATPTAEISGNKKQWQVGTLTYTTAGLVLLFIWLLWGDFAWSLKERSVPPILQLLLKRFQASDMLTGVLIGSLPAIIALLLGPIVSYKSDRHRGRWGRRIPFLLITTPIISLAMIGLAFSPSIGAYLHHALGLHSGGLNPSILIIFGTCWTLFEFSTITANAVFGALVNDVVPQSVIGRFYGMFRALGLIAGMIFNYWLLGKAETWFQWIFIAMGLLYGVGFTIMCLKVKEGEYPPPPPVEIVAGKARGFLPAAKTYLHECFGRAYYLWFFAAFALATMAMLPVNLFSVFYAKSIGMSMGSYGKCIALTYSISLVLAYPLGSLADRFHPLRLSMLAVILYAVVAILGGFFARNVQSFTVALIAHGVISGIYWTASASLAQRLLPRSRFAELASAAGIIGSLCSITLPLALGLFLDYTHHVYRYTFLIGGGLALLALCVLLVLHTKFMALGGPKNYVAPE